MINLKTRLKNPVFWVQVVGAFFLTALAYNNMQPQDLTTWEGLLNMCAGVIANPFLLATCIWNMFSAANDPTVKGLKDSERALSYEKPCDNTRG